MPEEQEVKREGTITLECSVKTLREFLAPLVALRDEAKFTVSPNGISTVVVDPAHICMVSLKLGHEAFSNISICGFADSFALDTDRFFAVLKNLEPLVEKVRLVVSIREDTKDQLSISNKDGSFHWSFDCPDLETISEHRMPDLKLKDLGPFKTKKMLDGLRIMSAITDHVRVINDPDFRFGVWFQCEDKDNREALSWQISEIGDSMRSEKVRSIYPLDYLLELLKALPAEGSAYMLLGTDYPLRLEFSFAQGTGEGTYYLAPRIESGD